MPLQVCSTCTLRSRILSKRLSGQLCFPNKTYRVSQRSRDLLHCSSTRGNVVLVRLASGACPANPLHKTSGVRRKQQPKPQPARKWYIELYHRKSNTNLHLTKRQNHENMKQNATLCKNNPLSPSVIRNHHVHRLIQRQNKNHAITAQHSLNHRKHIAPPLLPSPLTSAAPSRFF